MSNKIEYDVLLIGGSPSNLALAHHLVDLAKASGTKFTMAILEKGKEFGAHIVSGAVSNPRVIAKLFPDYKESDFPIEAVCEQSWFSVLGNKSKWDVPRALVPEGMKKEGYLVLTLSHVVYWMANKLQEKAKEAGIEIDMFPGFGAHKIVYEGDRVAGVQVVEEATGNADEDNIYGRVTCFGDKGFVSRDLIEKYNLRDNPQIWSVGVKETWQLAEGKNLQGKVWHTMGFPLLDGSFGGGFIYGMKDNKLTIGLIASLDSRNPNLNPQQRLQDLKKHPWLQEILKGGKLLKYGAAVLPEGGYYALPKKFAVDGAMLMGDALGVLDISRLSGVDKAMECGWQAAEVLHGLLKDGKDFTEANMAAYQTNVMNSFVGKELLEGRFFRYAWQENPRLLDNYLPRVIEGIDKGQPMMGVLNAGLSNNPFRAMADALRLKGMMEGKASLQHVKYIKDYKHIIPEFKPVAEIKVNGFDKDTIYSRPDAVFFAGTKYHEENRHIDEFNADTCVRCIAFYDGLNKDVPCVSDCTAEVHRVDVVSDLRKHGMSLENCVQCRTCEIVCPAENLRVNAASQGSGPDFMGL